MQGVGAEALQRFLDAPKWVCRRQVLHEYLDGKGVACITSSGASLCDNCVDYDHDVIRGLGGLDLGVTALGSAASGGRDSSAPPSPDNDPPPPRSTPSSTDSPQGKGKGKRRRPPEPWDLELNAASGEGVGGGLGESSSVGSSASAPPLGRHAPVALPRPQLGARTPSPRSDRGQLSGVGGELETSTGGSSLSSSKKRRLKRKASEERRKRACLSVPSSGEQLFGGEGEQEPECEGGQEPPGGPALARLGAGASGGTGGGAAAAAAAAAPAAGASVPPPSWQPAPTQQRQQPRPPTAAAQQAPPLSTALAQGRPAAAVTAGSQRSRDLAEILEKLNKLVSAVTVDIPYAGCCPVCMVKAGNAVRHARCPEMTGDNTCARWDGGA